MDQRVQLPLVPATVQRLPLLLTTYEPTRVNGKCAASVVTTPPTRRWCLHGAANRLRCLDDIAAVHGRWPTRPEFVAKMSQGNPAAPVEISPDGSMRWATMYRTGMVYNHLTAVHHVVARLHQHPPPTSTVAPATRHPFYALVKDVLRPFELWPRTMVLALVHHASVADIPHPMASSARTTPADLRGYVRRVRRACRQIPPLHGDVWMRVLFRMLPVNCCFAHLHVERPDAICCAYGYGHVETQHHALHACPRIHPVWEFHRAAWGRFGVTFSWSTISDPDLFRVNRHGDDHKDALAVLCRLLVGCTLHLIWTQHYKVQYEASTPLPSLVWHELSYLGWLTSVRRWLRLQDPDCPVHASALQVLHTLRAHPNYRLLRSKHPNSLLLGPTSSTAMSAGR